MITSAATIVDGKYAPAVPIVGARETILINGNYYSLEPRDYEYPTTTALSAATWKFSELLAENITLPSSFFGLHMIKLTNYPIVYLSPNGSGRTHDSGLRWDQIETSSGIYDWTRMDAYVSAFSGKDITYVVYGTPAFYSTDTTGVQNSPYKDDGINYVPKIASNPTVPGLVGLANFITALVLRYPTVTSIEVWNEPNADGATYQWWWGTQQELANLIQVIAIAAKAARPAIKIVSPATVGWASTGSAKGYIEAVLALVATGDATAVKNRIDVFGAHLYGANNSSKDLEIQIEAIKASQTLLGINIPIWDTESGLLQFAAAADLTAYTDINYYRRMFSHLMTCAGNGVQRCYWYTQDHRDMGFDTKPSLKESIFDTQVALTNTPLNIYRVGGEIVVQRISDNKYYRF